MALGAHPSLASVTISSEPTANMTCSGGICSPTATDATLNAGDLESLLASGSVEVTTTGSGIQANSIAVDAALTWSSTATLTLDAYQSIAVQSRVSVTGAGGLSVTTNDGGTGGTFVVAPKSSVTFQNLASHLAINGRAFKLEGSLPALAAAVKARPGGAYALANSYDATPDRIYKRSPIRTLGGALEGLGNAISHLSIENQYNAAMVFQLKAKGAIENLALTSVHVSVPGSYGVAGALVARNYGYLFNDSTSGTVVGTGTGASVGGLAGGNLGTGTTIFSSSRVKVTAFGGVGGGLLGQSFGTVQMSHASGDVSAFLAGGLVGQNEGLISQSFATGAVSGEAGGLVSNNTTDGVDVGTIENSYATGAIGGGYSGGFVQDQESSGAISSSYSTGHVPEGDGGFGCTGGAIKVADDYWNVTTSGATYGWCNNLNTKGVSGLTTKELRSGLPPGFDPDIWAQDRKINNGFPYLINNPPDK